MDITAGRYRITEVPMEALENMAGLLDTFGRLSKEGFEVFHIHEVSRMVELSYQGVFVVMSKKVGPE